MLLKGKAGCLVGPGPTSGEHFDEVIEKALNEAKCVIVMWSKRSVQSRDHREQLLVSQS